LKGRDSLQIKIIDYKKEYDDQILRLFYRSIFFSRKELDNARLPTWHHRYSLEEHNYQCLALSDNKFIGSLGLISYDGIVDGKKQKVGFFVDNCIDPDYNNKYNEIMTQLFDKLENEAKKKKIDIIMGWDYTTQVDKHNELFQRLGYSRRDGINWFGGGSRPIYCFSYNNFKLPSMWKIGLKFLSLKFFYYKHKLKRLDDVIFRNFENNDLAEVVELINTRNETLEFSTRYTKETLNKKIKKYSVQGIIAEKEKKIHGVLLFFNAPWSGWMFGKPIYDQKYGIILIRHPLEIAVSKIYQNTITPHLLLQGYADESNKGNLMFVGIFDRRETWLTEANIKIGSYELPYDFGTVIIKNLSEVGMDLSKPIYIPTNLVISPYTSKDY
jgi:hypothetical protein